MTRKIIIEPVSNGWVVSEHTMNGYLPTWLAVFNKMEDLQAALPDLLNVKQKGTEETEA